ncbi:hypothetical protein [Halobacillus naozhouensis]|uniref:Haemolysin XhlA n=1 Tax=Halobacillus naozhouensis TaxID=554880 RepID=A0ABY8J497_9BACI|nr:hypothetical protein [Halobacillus naozhouensis]WFT76253.1 hypothetical protein P9989_07785 [Halobacillus naozhouensis]
MPQEEMKNQERLAVVETELRQLTKMVINMNDKLDVWNQNYVPRNEINEAFRARDQDIKEIRDEVKEKAGSKEVERIVKDKDNWKRNLPAWAAFFLAVFTLLLRYI